MSESRTIGIIGSGRLGATLGRRWAEAGHTIRYSVRDPDSRRHDAVRDHAAVTEIPVAATGADLVLLAVPWSSVLKVADQLADLDTVVVDATNLLAGDRRGHDRDPGSSGAERLAARMPRERLVKAFNTTGSAT